MTVKEIISRSAEDLRRLAEAHHRLLMSSLKNDGIDHDMDLCACIECPHQRKLKETLVEVMEVLENTRRAFKSKQLEALRKKLIGVLADDA